MAMKKKDSPKIRIETRITEFAAVIEDGRHSIEKRGRSPQEALGALILNDPTQFGVNVTVSWGATRDLAIKFMENLKT